MEPSPSSPSPSPSSPSAAPLPDDRPLVKLLAPHLPEEAQRGPWAWLARQVGVRRASVAGWLAAGHVPGRRIARVCTALKDPPGLQEELVRLAGGEG